MESLTVRGTLEALGSVREYVMAAAAAAGLDRKATYRLILAVDEIATNAVVHGYADAGRQGDLELSAAIDTRSLSVTLEDSGPPFDPRRMPRPDDLDLPLERRDIGGLGVYLALKGVDRFVYEYAGGRNRNTFVMQRGAASPKRQYPPQSPRTQGEGKV
jgi:serine/threonine-protein kinase RsbW